MKICSICKRELDFVFYHKTTKDGVVTYTSACKSCRKSRAKSKLVDLKCVDDPRAELLKFLSYDKETGLFVWKKSNSVKIKDGQLAGRVNKKGYLVISLMGKTYLSHRLAWLASYGYLPDTIDHINRCKTDNRIENLRDVSSAENARNQKIRVNSKSGVNGVFFRSDIKKWAAYIWVDGKQKHLGFFVDKNDAAKARANADSKYGFHKNHGKEVTVEE
jgi:hypothetical protein